MRRFWTMLAHYHGQTWNSSELARSMGLSDKTVRSYLDILTGTFMVRQLQPWHQNVGKRQIKAPKIYLRDSGILHSLLDLQSSNITDTVVLGLMRESQNRIRSMALIHQTLYESKDFARVDFGNFLEVLVPALISSYAVGLPHFKLAIDAQDVLIPINAAIPCGLVVNELISNALKHAFPHGREGAINIHLAPENGDHVLLIVSDDGVGIPEDFDIDAATTLGLQLVTLLVDQLAGELDIQRANPTRFSVRFPLQRT